MRFPVGIICRCLTEFGRDFVFLHLVAEESFDAAEFLLFAPAHQGHSHAVGIGACRAAYSVHVILRLARHVVVHHHRYVVDVDAACQDVGGHEYVDFSCAECLHHLVALLLLEVGVHFGGFETGAAQLACEVFHFQFGGGEHYHPLRVGCGKEVLEQRCFLGLMAHECALVDFFGGA